MPSISRCPRCEQQVSIPPGIPGEITVRCPLCNAEYPLADALASLPPMLVPVGLQSLALAADVSAGPSPLGAGIGVQADTQAATDAVAGASGLTDFSGATGEEQVWGNILAGATETEVVVIDSIVLGEQPAADFEAPAAAGTEAALEQTRAELVLGASAAQPEQPEGRPAEEQLGQTASEDQQTPSAETAEDRFSLIEAGSGGEAALPFSIKTRPTRSREVNPLVHIGGMVVFGVVGLGLGYYFSNLLFGPRMDFLRIPLPFVRHTYKHWSGSQGEASEAETGDNGGASQSGAGASGGRNRSKPQQPQGQGQQGAEPPADQKPPSAAHEQPPPPQPGPSGDSATEKPFATDSPAAGPQPKQPSRKPDQEPGDEPMQLPGDHPDMKSDEPIEEPELDVPPKSGMTPPAK